MQIISKEETLAWLKKHHFYDSDGEPIDFQSDYPELVRYKIPVDSGRKNVLSRHLSWLFAEVQEESLLWIHEFDIWPSCENMNLFDGYRKSLGEESPLWEKPGHLFAHEDLDSVVSLVGMVLYFVMGAILISPTIGLVIWISHDEYLDIFSKDKEVLSKVTASLELLKLEKLDPWANAQPDL